MTARQDTALLTRSARLGRPTLPEKKGKRPTRFRIIGVGMGIPCLLLLSGCGLATLPFKATSKAIDWTTTSQDEADRNHGRAIRRGEEREVRCERRHERNC
jgi:hypothetical protein